MKKYLLVLPLAVFLFAAGMPVSAKTYSKIELLTIVLNNTYAGTGTYTEETCGPSDEDPTIEISFDNIDIAGTVIAASVFDGTTIYDSTGTIKKKPGNSFYTLKLDGTASDDIAEYTINLKGRITKTKPTMIRKVKLTAVADLNEDFSIDKCESAITFKKLPAQ